MTGYRIDKPHNHIQSDWGLLGPRLVPYEAARADIEEMKLRAAKAEGALAAMTRERDNMTHLRDEETKRANYWHDTALRQRAELSRLNDRVVPQLRAKAGTVIAERDEARRQRDELERSLEWETRERARVNLWRKDDVARLRYMTSERDRLRVLNADLEATCAALKQDRDSYATINAELDSIHAEMKRELEVAKAVNTLAANVAFSAPPDWLAPDLRAAGEALSRVRALLDRWKRQYPGAVWSAAVAAELEASLGPAPAALDANQPNQLKGEIR